MKLKDLIEKIVGNEKELPCHLEDYMSIVVLLALMGDVLLQIVTRYIFNNPIGWTEELARYLLMVLTFVGCPIAVRKNSNVSLDFIYSKLSGRVKNILSILKSFVELVFYLLGTVFSAQMCSFSRNRYLVTIRISKGILYGIITISFAIMAYRCLIRLCSRVLQMIKKSSGIEGGEKT